MKPTIAVVVVGLLVGDYVAPATERLAQSNKTMARGGDGAAAATGFWHREEDVFMRFDTVRPNGELLGVSLFRFNDNHWLEEATYSERASYQGDHWLLHEATVSSLSQEEVTRKSVPELRWDSGLSPDVLSVLIVRPEHLPISGLYTYARYMEGQNLSANDYWLAFWKKVMQPLGTGAMVLLAISFVFGPLRSVTMGFRIFVGIIAGLAFKYTQDLLGPMSLVYGFSPALATLVPIAGAGIVGLWLLRRAG